MEKIVIIGAGPVGYTAGIYAARANLEPLIITGNMPGGLLTQTTEVENFPGFPDGVEGFELVEKMRSQAERFGARIEYENAVAVELSDGGIQSVTLSDGRILQCRALIIATGATPRPLGIPAEEKFRNHGVSGCATCDGAFYPDVPVAVAGGGDSAMEEALFLRRFASEVFVIHRRDAFRASAIMQERARNNGKIKFILNTVIEDMYGESELEGLVLRNTADNTLSKLPCKACFTALGHEPATGLFRDCLELDNQNYIVRKSGTSETNLRGVFACGDCADPRYRQAITAAASGCQAAMDAEKYLMSRFQKS